MADAIAELNKLRKDTVRIRSGTVHHVGATAAIATADATSEATAVALANAIKASFNTHIADVVHATTGAGVHGVADPANEIATPDATSYSNLRVLVSDIEAKINAHVQADGGVHYVADRANIVPLGKWRAGVGWEPVHALLNECKAAINAHYASALNSAVAS